VELDFQQDTAPTRGIGAGNANCAGAGASSAEHPRSEPVLDLGRQMSDDVTFGHVDPDAGIIVDRRTGDQKDFVSGMQTTEVGRAFGEDRTVDGGAEARRLLRRKRRWCAVIHTG
jgi:hypothetical protein